MVDGPSRDNLKAQNDELAVSGKVAIEMRTNPTLPSDNRAARFDRGKQDKASTVTGVQHLEAIVADFATYTKWLQAWQVICDPNFVAWDFDDRLHCLHVSCVR